MRLSVLLLLLSCLSMQAGAQSVIKDIRAKYKVIRDNISVYDTTYVELLDGSSEGGEAIAYFDKKKIKLIEATWYGESGKSSIQFYYHAGKLFFAFEQKHHYNRPVYWDEKMAKESGDNEVYDPKKSKIEEDRLYFSDGKLYKWIDSQKKVVDISVAAKQKYGIGILKESEDLAKAALEALSKKKK